MWNQPIAVPAGQKYYTFKIDFIFFICNLKSVYKVSPYKKLWLRENSEFFWGSKRLISFYRFCLLESSFVTSRPWCLFRYRESQLAFRTQLEKMLIFCPIHFFVTYGGPNWAFRCLGVLWLNLLYLSWMRHCVCKIIYPKLLWCRI